MITESIWQANSSGFHKTVTPPFNDIALFKQQVKSNPPLMATIHLP